MTAWGIACHIEGGEAVVVAVEIDGPRDGPNGSQVFAHRTNPKDDWPQKLNLLAADLDTQLRRVRPDALVVRSLDWTPSRREAPTRQRYQVEGAMLAVARRYIELVRGQSGREIGQTCGSTKQAVEDEAEETFGASLRQAGAAAISALVLAEEARIR